eukprot:scaffold1002_cov135-Skeletonema_dohrnii-CCMP3373.AAC.2
MVIVELHEEQREEGIVGDSLLTCSETSKTISEDLFPVGAHRPAEEDAFICSFSLAAAALASISCYC